jgi:hypothetical protein
LLPVAERRERLSRNAPIGRAIGGRIGLGDMAEEVGIDEILARTDGDLWRNPGQLEIEKKDRLVG